MTYENRQLRCIPLNKGDIFVFKNFDTAYAGTNIFFPLKGAK